MDQNLVIHIIARSVQSIAFLLLTATFFLNFILVSYLAKEIWKIYRNKCEEMLNPHQSYLSKLKLYNYRTHITKYVLLCSCSVVELLSILFYAVTTVLHSILWNKGHNKSEIIQYDNSTARCKLYGSQLLLESSPVYVVAINMNFILVFLIFTITSISSRYLVARYLNLPFKRTLTKYLIWFATQSLIIAFCSSVYTLIFSFFLVPIIALIDLILLLRDNSFLSRVILSNLRNIQFFTFNKALYNQELAIYKFYRFFRIFLLTFAFSTFLIVILHYVIFVMQIFSRRFCLFHAIYHLPILSQILVPLVQSGQWKFVHDILLLVEGILLFIQAFSLSIPLLFLMAFPVIYRCVKLCRQKEDQFRFNYDTLQPLLTRRRH